MLCIIDTETSERQWISRGTAEQLRQAGIIGGTTTVTMAVGALACWAHNREAEQDGIERMSRHVQAQMMLDHEDDEEVEP